MSIRTCAANGSVLLWRFENQLPVETADVPRRRTRGGLRALPVRHEYTVQRSEGRGMLAWWSDGKME